MNTRVLVHHVARKNTIMTWIYNGALLRGALKGEMQL